MAKKPPETQVNSSWPVLKQSMTTFKYSIYLILTGRPEQSPLRREPAWLNKTTLV